MKTKQVTVMLVGLLTTIAFAGCLDDLVLSIFNDCGQGQIDSDPSLEEQERQNAESQKLKESRDAAREQQKQQEREALRQQHEQEQQQDGQQSNSEDSDPGWQTPADPTIMNNPPSLGRGEVRPGCPDTRPKNIIFSMNQTENRLEVVDVKMPKSWANITIHHGNCGSPHLNADGPPITDAKSVGNDSVKVGDFIQVYPEMSGCIFTLRDPEGGPPIGFGEFNGPPIDIVFSVNQAADRLEIMSVDSHADWGDITIHQARGCGAFHLNHNGSTNVVGLSSVGSTGDIVTPGDYIKVQASDNGCSFKMKFWLTNKPIGEWSFA